MRKRWAAVNLTAIICYDFYNDEEKNQSSDPKKVYLKHRREKCKEETIDVYLNWYVGGGREVKKKFSTMCLLLQYCGFILHHSYSLYEITKIVI